MHLPRGVSEVTFFNLIAHTLLSKLWTGVRHSRSFLRSPLHVYIYIYTYVYICIIYIYIVYVVYFPGDGSGRLAGGATAYIYMCVYICIIYIYIYIYILHMLLISQVTGQVVWQV